jgi:hypothetical protein
MKRRTGIWMLSAVMVVVTVNWSTAVATTPIEIQRMPTVDPTDGEFQLLDRPAINSQDAIQDLSAEDLDTFDPAGSAVLPEPATGLLLFVSGVGLILKRRRR